MSKLYRNIAHSLAFVGGAVLAASVIRGLSVVTGRTTATGIARALGAAVGSCAISGVATGEPRNFSADAVCVSCGANFKGLPVGVAEVRCGECGGRVVSIE